MDNDVCVLISVSTALQQHQQQRKKIAILKFLMLNNSFITREEMRSDVYLFADLYPSLNNLKFLHFCWKCYVAEYFRLYFCHYANRKRLLMMTNGYIYM